jgi:serine/threonine protein kinase
LKELLPGKAVTAGETPSAAGRAKDVAARFLREAKITGLLEHPSITPVHELGRRVDGTLYYTMKFVQGESLEKAIQESSGLNERLRLLPHFIDVCNAIAYAHSRGVIHRDIKPSNIMLGEYGETVVVDWGLAKVKQASPTEEGDTDDSAAVPIDDTGDAETMAGEVMGTPAYMSPEQARGDLKSVDERSDVYSLGAVLYTILTGQAPYAGENAADVVEGVVHREPRPLVADRKIPRRLRDICRKAMRKEPRSRYGSATDLAEAVQSWKPRKKRSKWVTRLEIGVLLAVLLTPPIVMMLDHFWQGRLDVEMSKIAASGGMTSIADFQMDRSPTAESVAPPSMPYSTSGFLVHGHELFPLIRYNAGPLHESALPLGTWVEEEKPVTDEEVRAMRTLVAEHSPLLKILIEVSERPPVSTEEIYGYKKLKYQAYTKLLGKTPNLLACRNSANYLLIDGYLAHVDGDSDLALTRCAQVMKLGNLIRDYPVLMAQMLANGVSFLGLKFAERLGGEAELSDETLQSFIALLDRSYRREAYLHSLDGERLAGIEQFEAIGHKVDYATLTSSDRGITFLTLLYGTQPFRFFRNRDEVKYLQIAQANIDLAALPYYESPDVFTSIPGSHLKWPLHSYPLTSLLLPHGPRLRQAVAEHETGVTLAVVGFQLKRYKNEHGAYPESLTALTPEFMTEVPLDEFDGKPLRYRREDEGFILYSVGTNLVDDGGEDSRGAGDYVWRFDS